MDPFIKQCCDGGVFPYPLEEIRSELEICVGVQMTVFLTKQGINLPEGTHSHNSYEFVVPLSGPVPTRMDRFRILINQDEIVPFNSEPDHGSACPLSDLHLLAVNIESEFIKQVSRSAFGLDGVWFRNEGIPFNQTLQNLIHLFVTEFKQRQAGHGFILQSLSYQIAVLLLRQLKSNLPLYPAGRQYNEKENINRAISFLRELYNKNYSLEQLAGVANLSPYHFIRVFKAQTGMTPYEYLLTIKLEKARELLDRQDTTITEVCLACGFNNLSHFSTVFKRKFGISPSGYRKTIWGTKQ
ncbi:MAG: AraC family transcriptional regulator [Heliobacteriaceae bacterium]|nr:AraC family transcriptional regulator [Heliobacteriaceae bacterium]